MADRKQTPDILGEMLGGDVGIEPEKQVKPTPTRSRTKPKRTPGKRSARAVPGWDILLVSFQDYKGLRPRYINGREIKDWMDGPIIHEYLETMGDEGWEIAAASAGINVYGVSDKHQVYFKRPK